MIFFEIKFGRKFQICILLIDQLYNIEFINQFHQVISLGRFINSFHQFIRYIILNKWMGVFWLNFQINQSFSILQNYSYRILSKNQKLIKHFNYIFAQHYFFFLVSKSQHQQLLRSIKECQERSRKTLENIDNTLLGVKQTLADIEITNKNIDKIKQQYSNVMDKLAYKIASSFLNYENPFKKLEGVNYQHLPLQLSYKQVACKIIKHQNILILTGAGVSTGSGIPTFRGKGGMYSNGLNYKGVSYQPEQFLTYNKFKQDPQGIWSWIDSIFTASSQAKNNQVHIYIDKLAKNLSKKGKKVVLATQNIDDLHLKPLQGEYEYYNIHGNCKYLRCEEHHFVPYKLDLKNGKCEECGKPLRPHILFFDQLYGKDYGGQIKERQFSLVICIGSSLKTGLAINMVQRAQQIIQINPQPVIQFGKVYRFTQKTNEFLKNIILALQGLNFQ